MKDVRQKACPCGGRLFALNKYHIAAADRMFYNKKRDNIGKRGNHMLSVCIITKNEEENIQKCLECLKPYGLPVVVVDTGSTDKTKEVVRAYTDSLYDFAWCDDFAAAKNYAVSKAGTPYVMVLDSDEFVEQLDVSELQKQLLAHPGEVGRIRRRNLFTRDGEKKENREWINRIFAKEEFSYQGRIHEQVTERNGREYETYKTSVVISHCGYDLTPEKRKEKAKRNETLLLAELERLEGAPEGSSEEAQIPYILYQLGKSCYMAKEYETACVWFEKGLSYDLNPALEYVIDMVETYGYALLNSGQAETALLFESIYDEFAKSADFHFLMGLIYMNNERFEDAAAEFMRATGYKESRSVGANSYLAYYNIGVIRECLGQTDEAISYYKKCAGYAPAKMRIESLTSGKN